VFHLLSMMQTSGSVIRMVCHGLGIVDNNGLNSYLVYCSHRREYRIWGRRRKRKSSRRQRELYTACVLGKEVSPVFIASGYLSGFVRLSCKVRAFFICSHGGVVSSIDAVCPSWRRYSVKLSHGWIHRVALDGDDIAFCHHAYMKSNSHMPLLLF